MPVSPHTDFRNFFYGLIIFGYGCNLFYFANYINKGSELTFTANLIDFYTIDENKGNCVYRYMNSETNELHDCGKIYELSKYSGKNVCPTDITIYWTDRMSDTNLHNCEFTNELFDKGEINYLKAFILVMSGMCCILGFLMGCSITPVAKFITKVKTYFGMEITTDYSEVPLQNRVETENV